MAHGITNLMNNIAGPRPKLVVTHIDGNRAFRRKSAKVTRDDQGNATRHVKRGTNSPFVNYEKRAIKVERARRKKLRKEFRQLQTYRFTHLENFS